MSRLSASAVVFTLATLAVAPTASAQSAVDFTGFTQSCMGAAVFLLGDVPPEVDSASVLTPLCGCLETSFGALSQGDVDELAADLAGTSTDETHTVREMCEIAFARVGLDWREYVREDPAFFRPAEVHLLLGDASKARRALGWEPKVSFRGLIEMMVDADMERVRFEIEHPKAFLQ